MSFLLLRGEVPLIDKLSPFLELAEIWVEGTFMSKGAFDFVGLGKNLWQKCCEFPLWLCVRLFSGGYGCLYGFRV